MWHREFPTVVIFVLVVIIALVSLFNEPIRGAFVSDSKALETAQREHGKDVELGPKSVWFVTWKGCHKEDVAVYKVLPYTNDDEVLVDNAVICVKWPFPSYSPRYK